MTPETLSAITTGVLSGGATGLLGMFIQRAFDYAGRWIDIKLAILSNENALALYAAETERLKAKVAAVEELAQIDAKAQVALQGEGGSHPDQSYAADTISYVNPSLQNRRDKVGTIIALMMAVVDFVRGILRPGMTAYLCVLTTVMFLWVKDVAAAHGVSLTGDNVMQLINTIIGTITYVFTTCALWWFGVRTSRRN